MITNRILEIILGILSIVVIPAQVVTTLMLGILISLTFGLLMFPLNLVWVLCFFYPLIGLSYVYEKAPILRIFVVILGIPVAILGNTFASLVPAMKETDKRLSKLVLTESFPYSWHYNGLSSNKYLIKLTNGYPNLLEFFNRIKPNDNRWRLVNKLKRENNI